MSDKLRTVAWTRDPGSWTLAHLTLDEAETLCGLPIPGSGDVHRVKLDVESKLCERCEEKARELGEHA